QHVRGPALSERRHPLGRNLFLPRASGRRASLLGGVLRPRSDSGRARPAPLPRLERHRAVGVLRLRLHRQAGEPHEVVGHAVCRDAAPRRVASRGRARMTEANAGAAGANDALLDRFCLYVRIDTQANEAGSTYPSSPGQLELGRLLTRELKAMGAADAHIDDHGIVMATIPATVKHITPTIAWIAHLDTSPETSAQNVKPIVHCHYDGGDIVLPGDPTKVLRVAENPELAALKGKTIVTTDGTTLLGADDKAGVAVIMETAAHLLKHPE